MKFFQARGEIAGKKWRQRLKSQAKIARRRFLMNRKRDGSRVVWWWENYGGVEGGSGRSAREKRRGLGQYLYEPFRLAALAGYAAPIGWGSATIHGPLHFFQEKSHSQGP
jgi:hypothetical protein